MANDLNTERPFRIVIAIPCLGTGGTERQTLSLIRVLRSCRLAVSVICYFEYEDSMVLEYKNAEADVELLSLTGIRDS